MKASEAPILETWKLCDFGLGFILEGSAKPVTYAGTHAYKPPVREFPVLYYFS